MCGWTQCHEVPLPVFACLGEKKTEEKKKSTNYTLGRKINTGIELCLQPRGPSFKPACQSRLADRTELRRPGYLFTSEIICAPLIIAICLNNEQRIYVWMQTKFNVCCMTECSTDGSERVSHRIYIGDGSEAENSSGFSHSCFVIRFQSVFCRQLLCSISSQAEVFSPA